MKIAFFEIKDWQKDYVKQNLSGFDIFLSDEKLNSDNLPEQNDFEVLSVFVASQIDEVVISHFPNLKLITTRSTGFDHINLQAVKKKGIKVAYVPGYGDNTVAEFAFGLLLTISRRIYESYDRLRETGEFSSEDLTGFDLAGKTMGILGTGRIGRYTARIAKGFGMNVIAYDPYPNEALAKETGFEYKSFEELLGAADVISIHVPYLESTHHLINMETIKKVKRGAVLINTARGAIVETDALIYGLKNGILYGAGLDVLEEEGFMGDEKSFVMDAKLGEEHNLKTIVQNHTLIDLPNIVITPHNAFNTKEAITRILNTDLENVRTYAEKGEPANSIPEKQ